MVSVMHLKITGKTKYVPSPIYTNRHAKLNAMRTPSLKMLNFIKAFEVCTRISLVQNAKKCTRSPVGGLLTNPPDDS
jgi:hypothetical protein